VTTSITITRDSSLRSMGVLYDVTIDGAVVGRLKRNESLTHEVNPGPHEVQALFAKTGWQIPDPRTSATTTFEVTEDENLQLAISLGPAWNQPTAQRNAEDYLEIYPTISGKSSSSRFRPTPEAATRLLLALVLVTAFITTAFLPSGSPGRTIAQIITGVASVALAALLYRHFRASTYR
jgi:hypothetical protein